MPETRHLEDLRCDDKVVLITGAGSGIGLATARRFHRLGAATVLVDKDFASIEKAAAELDAQATGGRTAAVSCNVAQATEVEHAVSTALDRFGRLDTVVNNAGVMVFKSIVDHSLEDWMKVLSVDLLGAFYFTKQAFLRMSEGGSIVNVASVHAVETTALVASYAAAKSALVSLTRTSSIEGQARKIRVNAILPGAVDTPMLWENPNVKSGLEVINRKNVGTPDEIASVITFLASDQACFVQGAAVLVDGGRLTTL